MSCRSRHTSFAHIAWLACVLSFCFNLGLLAPSSSAASSARHSAVRLGVTDDPDSFFFGGHLRFNLSQDPPLVLDTAAELGFGDVGTLDFITLRVDADFKYLIPIQGPTLFYPVITPSIFYINFGEPLDSETELGLSLGVGIEHHALMAQLSLALNDDLPDLKLTFGFLF